MVCKFNIETLQNIWIAEFVFSRSKLCSKKWEDNSKNILKSFSKSQSKRTTKVDEYYNCLLGDDYQIKPKIYLIRSLSHEIYLQKVTKNSLSAFVEKRFCKKKLEACRAIENQGCRKCSIINN